jgi:scyllo-inositol 2-dehydrogenase (NADP+)
MLKMMIAAIVLLALSARSPSSAPLRVGIIGLVHGHAAGFLKGGSALVPAGGALHRSDVQIVGIVEPDRQVFDSYARELPLAPTLYFSSIDEMVAKVHPQAALLFTNTFDHTKAVEECARRRVHVMMEKPLAVSYKDALAIADAAKRGSIHVLVNYETTWYASNKSAHDLLQEGALGDIRKVVVRDGHPGPKLIPVQPEFFEWLTDPKLDGAGALYDFGCYGADLMTWLMRGDAPQSVTAVVQHFQPDVYPKVDDEANIILTYPNANAILQASWNWPFDIKNMDVYGRTGYAKTIARRQIEVRRQGETEGHITDAAPIAAPYDDPLHYLAAVVRGDVSDGDTLSSLKTNVIVSEILDAARRSAQSGKTVKLPLSD